MPFYQYIHGARGSVAIKTLKIAGTNAEKPIALLPTAAGVVWDEGFDYVPVHEGIRELYAQVAGTRLGTWSVAGIVLDIDSSAASSMYDAFTAANDLVCESLCQSTGAQVDIYRTAPYYGVHIDLHDGSHLVSFDGIVLAVTLNAPIEGVLTMEFTGVTIGLPTISVMKEIPAPPRRTSASVYRFIRAATGKIDFLQNDSPVLQAIHALSFNLSVAREAQIIYSFGDPSSDAVIHDEDSTYGIVVGSRRFTAPLVASQGISSAGCTMLVESHILKRGTVTPGSSPFNANTFVEGGQVSSGTDLFPPSGNKTIYEPADIMIQWPSAAWANKAYRARVYNVLITGKRAFQLGRPRVPYLLTARPAAWVPGSSTIQQSLAKFELATAS